METIAYQEVATATAKKFIITGVLLIFHDLGKQKFATFQFFACCTRNGCHNCFQLFVNKQNMQQTAITTQNTKDQ